MYKRDYLSDKFIQRVAANVKNYAIIYTPRGKQLQRPITQHQFEMMFNCVLELKRLSIIHRDLTPYHFLTTTSSSDEPIIFLIDFGSAIFRENIQESDINYRGSVRFAATEILQYLKDKK